MDGNQGPDAVPANAVPANALPANALPANMVPANAVPAGRGTAVRGGAAVPVAGLTVAGLARSVACLPAPGSAAGLIDEIRELEDLKSALAARQARLSVAFDALRRREQARAGVAA